MRIPLSMPIGLFLTFTVASGLITAEEPPRHFRPVARPAVPGIPNAKSAIHNDIDAFVLAKLHEHGLGFAPEANRAELIRRASFDLTGLPPTVAESKAFLEDPSSDTYGKMVDRLLASPRYGERWGKYWLDAVGYADSNGYFNADSDRPLAWRYRDYVVKSFNADTPYDRFVREQIAGDELAGYAPGGDVTPAMAESLVATHFLRNAPDGTGESDGNPDEVRTDRFTVLEGNVQNLANSLLGLTVQCARCHDHKFEPFSQAEYYALQALLFPVYNPDRWAKPNDRVVTVGSRAEIAEVQRRNKLIDRQVKAVREGLAAFAEPLREQYLDERLHDLDPPTRTKIAEALNAAKDKRTAEQKALLKKHPKSEIGDEELAKRYPEYAALRDRVQQVVAEREKDRPKPLETVAAFVETDPAPAVHHVLKRGLHGQLEGEVQPGVPAALSSSKNPFTIEARPMGRVSTGRRTAFAKWVTSPENPLFARVMVNRIWQHHFGTGLVATADNLGASGAKPSHPELLDFLAAEFVASGWSVRAMHRLILNSAVYRQSSAPRAKLADIDPDNRLLARFPLRRLDAEAVRDAMLAVSGELDLRVGGPYVPSQRTKDGIVEVAEKTDGAFRRSIYLQQRRTQVVTFLQLFDAPSIVSTCGARSPSTVPLQSLVMLNSEFVRARSQAFAKGLMREESTDAALRLDLAFRLACGRPPLAEERKLAETFLAKQSKVYAGGKDAESRAWTDLCQMVFASSAFLYVD
jgi:Protein of unknown function (DUF1553)/Protein of unknown function (DUF1549)